MNIEKQNRQESLETGASLDQNREQILQNNPNFYKNKPSNKAGKKSLEVKATEYFTLLKTDINKNLNDLNDKEIWDLLSKDEQKNIKVEGWALLKDKHGNEKLINYLKKTYQVTENNRRGYAASPKYGPLTTFRTIAVDKSKIPLGSWVYVDFGEEKFSGWYQATDVGGAIKGNKIDIFTGVVPIQEVKGGVATKSTHIPHGNPTITWFEDGKIHPRSDIEKSEEETGESIVNKPGPTTQRETVSNNIATESTKPLIQKGPRHKIGSKTKMVNNYEFSINKEQKISISGLPGIRTQSEYKKNKKEKEKEKEKTEYEKNGKELSKSQIRELYKKGTKIIISFKNNSILNNAIKELQNEGLDIKHHKMSCHCSSTNFKENKKIYELTAKYIDDGKSFHIHCQHGAHRAPSMTAAGLMISKTVKVTSLGHAIDITGIKTDAYKATTEVNLLAQLIEIAQSQGIPVEEEYVNKVNKKLGTTYKATKGGEYVSTLSRQNENLPEAGLLHSKYSEKINSKEIKKLKTKDKKQLSESDIKDIRYNTRLLVTKENQEDKPKRISNIKQETARRISAYTSNFSNEWYTLDYQSVGGHQHEYGIGLGDILLDPDVNEILVQKDGEIIKASKGIPSSGKHKGRPSFVDENGNYVATLTGDKFRILSKTEVNLTKTDEVTAYIKKLDERHKASEEHKKVYIADQKVIDNLSVNLQEKPTTRNDYLSDETIIKRLSNREENDAQNIISYAKEKSKEFGIPYAVLKEMIDVESRWKPNAANPTSSARGLGQFLSGTWRSFIRHCNKNNIHDSSWGEKPLTADHRFNPYCCLYATLWYMNRTKKNSTLGAIINSSPIHVQGKIYYLAHHEGQAGAKKYLKFLEEMQKNGHNTKGEVLAAYNENPTKYNLILHSSQRSRIRKKGINKFLYVYFNLCNRIGDKAYASAKAETPELVAAYEAQLKANENTSTNGKLKYNFETKEGLKAKVDLKSNQDTWILGSSSAYGMDRYRQGNTGILGIIGANANNFFENFKNDVLPKIEKNEIKWPKEVILMGMSVNGLNNKIKTESTVKTSIERHMKIVEFFESKGVKVKITTVQPYQKKLEAIKLFNKTLKEQYPQYCMDISPIFTTANGNDWKEGMKASDNLHLSKEARIEVGKYFEENKAVV